MSLGMKDMILGSIEDYNLQRKLNIKDKLT